jgi:hypothetical protein
LAGLRRQIVFVTGDFECGDEVDALRVSGDVRVSVLKVLEQTLSVLLDVVPPDQNGHRNRKREQDGGRERDRVEGMRIRQRRSFPKPREAPGPSGVMDISNMTASWGSQDQQLSTVTPAVYELRTFAVRKQPKVEARISLRLPQGG